MKIKLAVVAVLSATMTVAADDIFRPGEFFIGCNFWGSKAGVHMWRQQDWDAWEIEKDIAAVAASGVEVMRVFPTWSEFQPIVRNIGCSGKRLEYLVEGKETPVYDPYWLDGKAVERFRFFCDAAHRHKIKLMVAVLTGWMSGRLFFPRAVEGMDLLTDNEALMVESRFMRAFVRRFRNHPAIAAWDLGNECNNLGTAKRPEDLWVWLNMASSAIRIEDPSRPVIAGMHGMSSDFTRPWNLRHQGELLDILTPHTYPSPYRPEANRGALNTFRNAMQQPAQSLFYEGVSGRRAFPQEVGNFGPTMSPDWMAALGIRQQAFATWMHGLAGYLWWVAFDQDHLAYPPFENNSMERELGMIRPDAARTPKPQAQAIREFRRFKDSLPFKAIPPRRIDAVCLVSEMEEFWQTSFGAFMLVKQAGFDVAFCGAESQELPEASLYIVPSGTGWSTYSNRAWTRVVDRVKAGATMIVSRGGQAGYSDWLEVAGLESVMYNGDHKIEFDFAGSRLRASDTFVAEQKPVGCDVLARDQTGNTVVSIKRLGRGKVIVVNFDLEHQVALGLGGSVDGKIENPMWKLYAFAAKEAGVVRRITRDDTGLVVTEHPGYGDSTLVMLLNTHGEDRAFDIRVDGEVASVWNGEYREGKLHLRRNDGCIMAVK
ncbi:MAG: hypothetical protein IJG84_17450 [Kiritimatiellae bacterium]|nr:hypothetical protein [Kiritimatiellia bacterium]